MSRSTSRGTTQVVARMCGTSSRNRRRQPSSAGPAPTPSPRTVIKSPPGYKADKKGGVIVLRRSNMGQDVVSHDSGVSCHEHRTHLHTEGPLVAIVIARDCPDNAAILPVPMHAKPRRRWRHLG